MSLRGSDAVSVVKSVTQSANASAERKLSTDSFTVKSSLQPKNDQAYAPESNAVHQRRRATRGGETKARAGVSLGPEAAKVPENEAQVRRGQLRLDHVLVLVLVLVRASPISLYASRQSVAQNLRSSSCVGLDFKFFKFKFF